MIHTKLTKDYDEKKYRRWMKNRLQSFLNNINRFYSVSYEERLNSIYYNLLIQRADHLARRILKIERKIKRLKDEKRLYTKNQRSI